MAIQASRISTYLHFWSVPGVLPFKMKEHWPNPCVTFFSSGTYSKDLQPEMLQALIQMVTFRATLTSPLRPTTPTGVNSKSARVLLLLVVPGQLVFLYTISLLQGQEAPVSVAFTVCYLCAALLQVD